MDHPYETNCFTIPQLYHKIVIYHKNYLQEFTSLGAARIIQARGRNYSYYQSILIASAPFVNLYTDYHTNTTFWSF